MGKNDIVKLISQRAGISGAEAEIAVDVMLNTIHDTAMKGENVLLKGFGTFKKKHSKARDGRNPHTGASIKIPAKTTLAFKAAKQ